MSHEPRSGQHGYSDRDKLDRVRRACDRCNTSRTRCTGEIPCRRCSKLNSACQYERTVKKRGPKPKSSRQACQSTQKCSRRDRDRASCSRESTSSGDSSQPKLSLHTTGSTPGSDSGGWIDPSPTSTSTPDAYFELDLSSPYPFFAAMTSDCHMLDSAGGLYYNKFPIGLSPLPTSCATDSKIPTCRYPCLNPILPFLKDILRPEEACDLLDIFFAGSGRGQTSPHCPYVLSPVIRKRSLLCQTSPRPVSSALVAIILWCVSHTANLDAFLSASARTRVTQRLYFLSMKLLQARDGDNSHDLPGSWGLNDLPLAAFNQNSFISLSKPESNVDDVLSFVLLACVNSGSDFKEDCLKWWNKAVLLVKKLGYNSEARIAEHTPSSQQMSLASREEHEERRRVFWLVYALDRHLSLCFNEPLRIHDSECHVLSPLPEYIWQNLDAIPLEDIPPRVCGPSTCISGTGFFEYFLPLMAILGDIIEFRSRSHHWRLGGFDDSCLIGAIEGVLADCEYNLGVLQAVGKPHGCSILVESPDYSRMDPVFWYSRYIIRVLYILLYNQQDSNSDLSGWTASPEFLTCMSNSLTTVDSLATSWRLTQIYPLCLPIPW
ncbi:fungal-specific transcription factor domain-containing protein [Aspergillus cavernicola]|uniref:Xylanolytic transcriptional activator xlnR n=1 Tax=Aspergillus cavernicola TaxID=176166 RepID=A0ABR4I695_9EURO